MKVDYTIKNFLRLGNDKLRDQETHLIDFLLLKRIPPKFESKGTFSQFIITKLNMEEPQLSNERDFRRRKSVGKILDGPLSC